MARLTATAEPRTLKTEAGRFDDRHRPCRRLPRRRLDDRDRRAPAGLHRLAGHPAVHQGWLSRSRRSCRQPGIRWPTAPAFGLLPFIGGTLAVTVGALLISTPLSVGLAVFLSEVAPHWARAIVQPALEIFVGIPSVVWGWLGLTILVPFLADTFHGQIALSLPVVGTVFSMPGLPDRLLLDGRRAGALGHGPADHHERLVRRLPGGPAGASDRIAGPGNDSLADDPAHPHPGGAVGRS